MPLAGDHANNPVEEVAYRSGLPRIDTVAVLGHSWGGVLAMEYALHYPERVSHLILMNTAPVSHEDILVVRREIAKGTVGQANELNELRSSAEYQAGNPSTVAEYYRIRYGAAFKLSKS